MREVWGTRLGDAVDQRDGLPRWRADSPPEGGTPWRACGWAGIGPPAGRIENTPCGGISVPALHGDEDELYRRHHHELRRAVAHAVNAPRELIEDACQNAWTIMLRAQPDRISVFGWLYVVATREAFRLCERERRHIHLEVVLPSGSWDAVIADAFSIEDIIDARQALEALSRLPDRQRVDLTLLVAGFSYREIAQLTGGRTY